MIEDLGKALRVMGLLGLVGQGPVGLGEFVWVGEKGRALNP